MRVNVTISGSKYKASAKLERIASGAMLLKASRSCSLTRFGIIASEKMEQVGRFQPCSLVRHSALVNQQRKCDSRFFAECPRIKGIAESNGGKARACFFEFVLVLAQLRDVLAAEDSAVVAQKDHHGGSVLPQRAEPDIAIAGIGQNDWRELFSKR